MKIRLAAKQDLPAMLQIYNEAIAEGFATADTEPVTVEQRLSWFRQHNAAHYPIYITEVNGAVAGWCSLSPWRAGRKALYGIAEISYYIAADRRRQGLAGAMIDHSLRQAPQLGLTHFMAILLDRNEASVRLLEKKGFTRWGHLPEVARFGDVTCGQHIYGRRV